MKAIDLSVRDFAQEGLPVCDISISSDHEQQHSGTVDIIVRYRVMCAIGTNSMMDPGITDVIWQKIVAMMTAAEWMLPDKSKIPNHRTQEIRYPTYTKFWSCPVVSRTAYEAIDSDEITPALVRELWGEMNADVHLVAPDIYQRIRSNRMLPMLLLEDPGLAEILQIMPGVKDSE